jgi:hypothetical protein
MGYRAPGLARLARVGCHQTQAEGEQDEEGEEAFHGGEDSGGELGKGRLAWSIAVQFTKRNQPQNRDFNLIIERDSEGFYVGSVPGLRDA